jgi:hypothetical protein
MNQIIRISRQGIDVLDTSGTLPNNLIFDSSLNTFKIVTTGTVTGTISSSSTGTVTVAHNLSYAPVADGFIRNRGFGFIVGSSQKTGPFQGNYELRSISADETNVYFEIRNAGFSDGTFDCRYYCYESPLV